MRHVFRFDTFAFRVVAAVAVVAIVAAGCASMVDVDAIDVERISQASTWTFRDRAATPKLATNRGQPKSPARVTAPLRDARKLDAEVAGYVRNEVDGQGFVWVDAAADLYVDFQVTLQPRVELVEVSFAQRYVPSLSFSPSYLVDGTDLVERAFENLRLEINLRDAAGRVLWRGELTRRFGEREALVLEDPVHNLLSRIPASHSRSGDTGRATSADRPDRD